VALSHFVHSCSAEYRSLPSFLHGAECGSVLSSSRSTECHSLLPSPRVLRASTVECRSLLAHKVLNASVRCGRCVCCGQCSVRGCVPLTDFCALQMASSRRLMCPDCVHGYCPDSLAAPTLIEQQINLRFPNIPQIVTTWYSS
jgi:hypothetical protein